MGVSGIMKKIILILGILLCLSTAVHAQIVGEVLSTDITAFIDEQPIESFNINGYTYVIAEDLRDYGFSVTYNESERTLLIERDREADRGFLAMEKVNIKKADVPFRKKLFDVYETDIVTYIGSDIANAYNVNGQTLIMIDELSRFGNFSYDNNARCVKIDMAGFDEKIILSNENNKTIPFSPYKINTYNGGVLTYEGGLLNDIPNGFGVIHESCEHTDETPPYTENFYYSGNFKNGEMDGYIHYHGEEIFYKGNDRNERGYYELIKYTNGTRTGYGIALYYEENELVGRYEWDGDFRRFITIDESYRYGYRIDDEGMCDSNGEIIDYVKTEAGKIKSVSAYQSLRLVTAEDGDLYAFGYLSTPNPMRKLVPVKIDEGISFAAAGAEYPAVIDESGKLYYLWDKIKYNKDAPVVWENVKKTDEDFFLTNDGKLYRKPNQYSSTLYNAPELIEEDVKDYAACHTSILYIKNNGDVYFMRYPEVGVEFIDGFDLSKPTKVFENAKAVSCIHRFMVVDENNTLWGWSSPTYNTPYENEKTNYKTTKPIIIAEDVVFAEGNVSFIAYTKTDGSLYVCPDYTQSPDEAIFGITEETKLLDDVKQFSSGYSYIFAVKNDGTLWVWGNPDYSGFDDIELYEIKTPLQIKDFYKFKE